MLKINNNNVIPIRIAVTGITGRMGIEVTRCLVQYRQQQKVNGIAILTAAIVRSKSEFSASADIKSLLQSNNAEVIITDDIELVKNKFDILIDFTHPEATMKYLEFCMVNRKNMIIGTTGLNQNHYELINFASQKIGIVYSANFSIGIVVMLNVLREITRVIGNIFNIDIIELHHGHKKDIPSGTALAIRNIIKSNIPSKNNIFHESVYSSILQELYLSSLSQKDNIKISSIRSGDIVGEHIVLFSGIGEQLKIKHIAFNRKIFANGALCAAIWLGSTKTGLFNVSDILKKN